MNKLWIAAPVILLVAAAPYFTGPQAEQALQAGTAEINQYFKESGLPLKVAGVSYTKGFLSSQAINRVELTETLEGKADSSYCIELTTKLNHGYLSLIKGQWGDAKTTIRPLTEQSACALGALYTSEKQFADFYQKSFDVDGPAILNAHFSFSGGADIDFTVHPFDIDETMDSETINVSVKQLQGNFDVSSDWDSFTFNLNWPGMKAEGHSKTDTFAFSLGNYAAVGEQTLAYPNLWVGSVVQTLGEFKVHNDGAENVNMGFDSLEMIGDTSIEDDKLRSSAQLSLEGIAADSNNLGDFSLNLDISQFDAKALDNLMGTIKELIATLQQAGNPEVKLDFDQATLAQDIKTIADSGIIEIKSLDYSIGDNSAYLDGAFNLADLQPVPANVLIENPLMLINHLKVTLNAELDEALVRDIVNLITELDSEFEGMDAETKTQFREQMMMQFTQFAQNFTQSSYLLYDADKSRYKTTLTFKNGEARVNDQPFGIPNLGG